MTVKSPMNISTSVRPNVYFCFCSAPCAKVTAPLYSHNSVALLTPHTDRQAKVFRNLVAPCPTFLAPLVVAVVQLLALIALTDALPTSSTTAGCSISAAGSNAVLDRHDGEQQQGRRRRRRK